MNPRFWNQMASYDVAKGEAVLTAKSSARIVTSFLELNDIL